MIVCHGVELRKQALNSELDPAFSASFFGLGASGWPSRWVVVHMGDRYDRDRAARLKRYGSAIPPEPILTWGIGDVSTLGHNGGPPLDEEPGYLWRKYRWTEAYKEAWKTPSMAVLKFRVARAEAAGLSYHDYMLQLLDTGRHAQKDDVGKRARAVAKPAPLGSQNSGPNSGPNSSRGSKPMPTAPAATNPAVTPLAASSATGSNPAATPQVRAPSGRAIPQPLDGHKRR